LALYVDAGLPAGPDGVAKCTISIGGATYDSPYITTIVRIFPDAPELIVNYCNLYGRRDEHGINVANAPTEAGIARTDPLSASTLATALGSGLVVCS